MNKPKTIKQHAQESPQFGDKLREVVLSADFKPHMFPSGVSAADAWINRRKDRRIMKNCKVISVADVIGFLGQSGAAKELGVNRGTIRKYMENPPDRDWETCAA